MSETPSIPKHIVAIFSHKLMILDRLAAKRGKFSIEGCLEKLGIVVRQKELLIYSWKTNWTHLLEKSPGRRQWLEKYHFIPRALRVMSSPSLSSKQSSINQTDCSSSTTWLERGNKPLPPLLTRHLQYANAVGIVLIYNWDNLSKTWFVVAYKGEDVWGSGEVWL